MESTGICHGPEDFEGLLERAGLSDREADAVRSVALSMTARDAAPCMGVSPSTVGSYRQRAYAKLGVLGRAEFLGLPEVAAWRASSLADAAGAQDGPAVAGEPSADAGQATSPRPKRAIWALGVAALFLVVAAGVLLLSRVSRQYATGPSGVVATDLGEVPNVAGMRADAAASLLASHDYCPEFEARASEATPGTVLGIRDVGAMSELDGGISSLSWGEGCTAGYERHGQWAGYVTLVVAV